MGKNYYDILGLDRSAKPQEIRTAYLRLARKWHPDVNKDSQAKSKFQDISEAYEILSHPTRKQIYDRGGEEALTAGGKRTTTGPIRPGQRPGIPPNSVNRLAAQFFGYGIHGLNPETGAPLGGNNIPTRMGIPGFNLAGFTNGTTVVNPNGVRTTTYSRRVTKKPDPPKPKKHPVLLALECTLEELFSGCEKTVTWETYEDNKHISKEAAIAVQPGWTVGHKIELEDGNDEVTIIVTELPHPIFKRKKEDLYYDCRLTLKQALCEGKIVIPTIVKGKNLRLKFDVVDNNQVHEISGYGMPIEGTDQRGKLIVTFNVKLPQLSSQQKKQIAAVLNESANCISEPS